MTSTETPMQVLVVVEDDPDVQFLIESIFSMDPRFNAADVAESAEAALEWSARTAGHGQGRGAIGPLRTWASAAKDRARRRGSTIPAPKAVCPSSMMEPRRRASPLRRPQQP